MAGRTARPREDEAVRPRPAGKRACRRPRGPDSPRTRMVACISCSETVCSLRHPRLAAASSAQLRSVLSSRSPWHLVKQAGLDGRRTARGDNPNCADVVEGSRPTSSLYSYAHAVCPRQ